MFFSVESVVCVFVAVEAPTFRAFLNEGWFSWCLKWWQGKQLASLYALNCHNFIFILCTGKTTRVLPLFKQEYTVNRLGLVYQSQYHPAVLADQTTYPAGMEEGAGGLHLTVSRWGQSFAGTAGVHLDFGHNLFLGCRSTWFPQNWGILGQERTTS